MKLYAYRRAGRIEFETCQLPPEAHVTDICTIEGQEPGKEKLPPVTVTMEIIGMDILKRRIESLAEVAGRLERVLPKGEQSKKTVTKEAEDRGPTGEGDRTGYIERFFIPANAKNIHCTYEVEE